MANQINSGSLDTLKIDDTLLVHVQQAANNSYQALFIERIDRNNRPTTETETDNDEIDALSTLNYGDSRFQQGSVNYKYTGVTNESLALLKIKNADGTAFDLDTAEFNAMTQKNGKVVQCTMLNIINPTIQEESHVAHNMRYRLKLVETHVPTTWQLENSKHKINPSTDEALTKNVVDTETGEVINMKIYSAHKMVFTNNPVKHIFIKHDKVTAPVKSFEKQPELSIL